MRIEVAGKQYSGWVEAEIKLSMDNIADKFKFSATAKDGVSLPFRGGEECRVFVDGERVLTGHIEIVNVSGDNTEHTINISGRDRTGDVVDSKIGALADIRSPVTLKRIIENVLKHIDSPIKVTESFSPRLFTTAEDLSSPEPGQDVWDFIETLARTRQVLLTSNSLGNIEITRSSGIYIRATLQNNIKDDSNNVISYSVAYDTTGVYRIYRISSQLNPIAVNNAGDVANDTIVEQRTAAADSSVRRGRQFVKEAEKAGNALDRVIWEYNIRQARSMVYSATVDGFRNATGNLWAINEIVNVHDEYAGIDARMLVNSVQFSIADSGRRTMLSLVNKNSYTLSLEPTLTKTDKLGVGITDEEALFVLGILR